MSCSHRTRRTEPVLSVNNASCFFKVFPFTFTVSVGPFNVTRPAMFTSVLICSPRISSAELSLASTVSALIGCRSNSISLSCGSSIFVLLFQISSSSPVLSFFLRLYLFTFTGDEHSNFRLSAACFSGEKHTVR